MESFVDDVFVRYFDMYGFYIFVLFINLNYLSCVFMDIFICWNVCSYFRGK